MYGPSAYLVPVAILQAITGRRIHPIISSLMGQITYKTGSLKTFDIYNGVENALNTKQLNPLVSADKPFSPYFDAS